MRKEMVILKHSQIYFNGYLWDMALEEEGWSEVKQGRYLYIGWLLD